MENIQNKCCGKMYAARSAPMEAKTSGRSSRKSQGSQTKTLLFLDLRRANGHTPDASWETDGASLGAYTTRSFGECPSVARESRLSQILEVNAPLKYCLSEKACLGILRRAENRGKVLPPMLDQALRRQAGLLVSKSEPENQGGGKGILIQDEHTGALSTLNNQLVCYGMSAYDSNSMKSSNPHSGIYKAETARTLDLNGGSPACNQGGMMVLEGNGSRPSHKGDGYAESEISYTLNAVEQHAVCVENHPNDSRVKIRDDGIVQTLSGRMGTGGGNVPMVLERDSYQDVTGSLCASGYDKLGVQEAANDLYVVQRTYAMQAIGEYKESDVGSSCKARDCKGSTDLVCTAVDVRNGRENPDINGTIQAKGNGGWNANSNTVCRQDCIVRRLTPLECTRLQGFPDGLVDIGDWVDSKGKTHRDADSPKYKALGNSIALPFWEWMARRMAAFLPENASMGSLFDGIGGFPLAFSRAGVRPVWASEIEEFCIAVTKKRFWFN